MFPAIETPAQKRTAIVDGATRGAQINAFTVVFRGEEKDRVAGIRVSGDPNLVRRHIVALVWMEEQRLAAPAAFRATRAGHFRLVVRRQLSFYTGTKYEKFRAKPSAAGHPGGRTTLGRVPA